MAETKRDYYEVLGVPKDADEAALKKAYRVPVSYTHLFIQSLRMRFYAFCTENTDPEIQGDIFMAKEMIAMLLALSLIHI